MSVLYHVFITHSTLKKKGNSIAYHYVREGAARDEWRTNYVNIKDNLANFVYKSNG